MATKHLAWALVAAGAIAAPLAARQALRPSVCCVPAGNDMPVVGGNLGNQRYSSLAAINRQNIQNLGAAWRVNVSAVPPATSDVGSQTTPVVVNGVIYLNTPAGGVIAVDGATGTSKWKWQPTAFQNAGQRRGVSVGEGKVFALGSNRVVALDANTGREIWVVEPKATDGTAIGVGAVGTLYHDGMVYVATSRASHAILGMRASDGAVVWTFNGIAEPGRVVTDVNGVTTQAGDSWGNCPLQSRGGGDPWIHGAIDPELGLTYYTLSNARGCGGSQDASGRPGQNLFANTLVALDLKTGAYKWHFQSIHQDIWDMDNVHAPLLADVMINGQTRKVIYYGSKSAHLFPLDRATGKPLLKVDETPVILDKRQNNYPTQPVPSRPLPTCLVWQPLDPKNVPGDPWRAVPNYNGYQPDATGKLVYTEPNYLDPDKPFLEYPSGKTHREGCLYDVHWDLPVLSMSSQNGGPTWSTYSFSHKLGLIFFPYGVSPVAHWRAAGGNGQRAIGQYQTGGILAIDAATNTARWTTPYGTDMGHGQNPLSTAGDLVFVGMFDGYFLALDAATGKELWRFQTGSAISAGPISYTINGEQYVVVFAAGGSLPYGNSVPRGDSLWAFKLGGTYKTASGSSEAPVPPLVTVRRPVSGMPIEGSTVNNTVYLARASRAADTALARDSVDASAMIPTHLRVPVGTTVTFLNPGAETFPNFPNQKLHCATQYFEGLFNAKVNPGQRFQYTFDRAGEYYFNDCTDPRPTGKIVAYHTPQDVPGAVTVAGNALDLRSPTGVFTGVQGSVTARFAMPAGYTFEGDAMLKAPLSQVLIPASSARVEADGRTVVIQFNKAEIDNNMPAGDAVPLVLSAHFRQGGAQKQLTSTVSVRVAK